MDPVPTTPPVAPHSVFTQKRLLGLAVVVLIFLSSFLLYQNIKLQTYISNQNSPTPAPTSAISRPVLKNALVYLNAFDLYAKTADKVVQLTQGNHVIHFDYNQPTNTVAYITTDKSLVVGKGITSNTTTAHILNLDTNDTKEIISLKTVPSPASDYEVSLRHLKFSGDGKTLGITSSDSFWTYDTKAHTLKNIFAKPVEGNVKAWIYAYREPIFSPSGKLAIISKGFYEGSAQASVDLASGELTDFDRLTMYVSGEKILDWYNSDDSVITITRDEGNTDYPKNTIEIREFPSFKSIKSFALSGSLMDHTRIGNKLYLLVQEARPNGKYIETHPLRDYYHLAIELDLETGTQKKLYEQLGNYGPNSTNLYKITSHDGKLIVQVVKTGVPGDPPTHSLQILDHLSSSPSLTPYAEPASLTIY